MKKYRSFIREQKRELDSYHKQIFGYGKAQEDEQFTKMFDSCVNDKITEQEFESYLNNALMLSINDQLLKECCDEEGNIINEKKLFENYEQLNEIFGINKAIKGAVNKGVQKAKQVGAAVKDVADKAVTAVKNVAMVFFKAVIDKIKAAIKGLSTALLGKDKGDKAVSMMASFVEKIAAGLNKFAEWLKKNKKGVYSIIIKVMASLGITSIVSAIMSYFGAGWVAAMGGKLAATEVGKRVGKKASAAIVKESMEEIEQALHATDVAGQGEESTEKEEGIIEVDPSKFTNFKVMSPDELKEFGIEISKEKSDVKKVMMKIGSGVVKFFKVYRKLKIAIVIFFGVCFILSYFFAPLLDSLMNVVQLKKFTDVFDHDFGDLSIPVVENPSHELIQQFDPTHINGQSATEHFNIPLKEPGDNYLNLQEINNAQSDVVKKIADNVEIDDSHKDAAGSGLASLVNDMRGQVGHESVPLSQCDVHTIDTSTIDDGHGNTLYTTGTPAGETTTDSAHGGTELHGTNATQTPAANAQTPKSFDDVPKIKTETDEIINKLNQGKLDPKAVGQLGLDVKQGNLKDLITGDGYKGDSFDSMKFDNDKLQGQYDKWIGDYNRGNLSGEALNNRIRGLQVLADKMGK